MADRPKGSVAREPLLALAELIAADCQEGGPPVESYSLKLRVWEAGTRFEDWRLIVIVGKSGRQYQVRAWADWERLKRQEHYSRSYRT